MKLKINGVYELGKESVHVTLEAIEPCNAHDYMVMDNTYDQDGDLSNLLPHVYRFPKIDLKKGDSIRLFSGKGKRMSGSVKGKEQNTVHLIYWGLEKPIWNKEGDKIYLFKTSLVDTKQVGEK